MKGPRTEALMRTNRPNRPDEEEDEEEEEEVDEEEEEENPCAASDANSSGAKSFSTSPYLKETHDTERKRDTWIRNMHSKHTSFILILSLSLSLSLSVCVLFDARAKVHPIVPPMDHSHMTRERRKGSDQPGNRRRRGRRRRGRRRVSTIPCSNAVVVDDNNDGGVLRRGSVGA
jgi:hypothetical protein